MLIYTVFVVWFGISYVDLMLGLCVNIIKTVVYNIYTYII